MSGKDKCRLLKDIRKKTAEENGIPFETTECGFKGECKGTCPKCEAELKYINEQLERRKKFGKAAVAVAVSASLVFAAGCTPNGGEYQGAPSEHAPETQITADPSGTGEYSFEEIIELEGDVPYIPEDEEEELVGAAEEFTEEPILSEGDVPYVPEDEEG